MNRRFAKVSVNVLLISLCLYSVSWLYFYVTAGFTYGNITGTEVYQGFEVNRPSEEAALNAEKILDQPFSYLGKGQQSYVFESADGQYVLKFLKLQRFRPKAYVEAFTFIPSIASYQNKKREAKRDKLFVLLGSWKIAYENLADETGVVYLHIPGHSSFSAPIKLKDKSGLSHTVPADQTAFLLQRKAEMLCPVLEQMVRDDKTDEAKKLLSELVATLVAEYKRGYGDNDHALMQNTGVLDGKAIHIDVGLLTEEERFKDLAVYREELFSKTYKFRMWLTKHYPELERHLYNELYAIIGPDIATLKPKLKTIDEGA